MNIFNSVSIWNANLTQIAQQLLAELSQAFERVLPITHAHLYEAMVFGVPIAWDSEIKHLLEIMGIQHIFSASGYNLSVVISFLQPLASPRFPRRALGIVFLSAAAAYCYLAGWQVSLLRAFVMFAYASLATYLLARQYRPLFGLFVCVCLLVLIDQSFLTSISFQLSASATLGITLFAPLLSSANLSLLRLETGVIGITTESTRVGRFSAWLKNFIAEGVLVSLAAQAFSLPISLYHFGTVSAFSILANLCLFWLVPYLFIGGLVGCLVLAALQLFPGVVMVSNLVGLVLWLPAELFFQIMFQFSGFDWSIIRFSSFPWWAVGVWWCSALALRATLISRRRPTAHTLLTAALVARCGAAA